MAAIVIAGVWTRETKGDAEAAWAMPAASSGSLARTAQSCGQRHATEQRWPDLQHRVHFAATAMSGAVVTDTPCCRSGAVSLNRCSTSAPPLAP